jgi:hypothetical protein
MRVYYYKVLARLAPMIIPGERETEALLPGDTLQVGEAGHAFFQQENFPFKDALLLVGSTFLGEKPAEAVVEPAAPMPDQVLAELLEAENRDQSSEQSSEMEVSDPEKELELPPVGSKVVEVMQYLKLLEQRGYTLEQLEEVRQRFQSVTVHREVERLKQEFLEQSLTIAG